MLSVYVEAAGEAALQQPGAETSLMAQGRSETHLSKTWSRDKS